MKWLVLLIVSVISILNGYSQNTFKALIKDSFTEEPIVGATVVLRGTNQGSISDSAGLVQLNDIPDGKQILVFSYLGYKQRVDTLIFSLRSSETPIIFMESAFEEMEEVVISSTRSTRGQNLLPAKSLMKKAT